MFNEEILYNVTFLIRVLFLNTNTIMETFYFPFTIVVTRQ